MTKQYRRIRTMTSLLGSNNEHKADFKEWSVLLRVKQKAATR
jgi:hypothetical protein